MNLGKQVTSLVDRLQAKLDQYIQRYETLLRAHNLLLTENETLKDKIAELMGKKSG